MSFTFDFSSFAAAPAASESVPDATLVGRVDDDDVEVDGDQSFLDKDFFEIFSQAIVSSASNRVAIPALGHFESHVQQFYLVVEIIERILASMLKGSVPSCDPTAMAKLGAVLIKLGKLPSMISVDARPKLAEHSFEDLVQNLGITTLRRKPRNEPFILLGAALECGSIEMAEGSYIRFSLKGVVYHMRFHNRLCVELSKGDNENSVFDSTCVARFNILAGGLRASMETFKNISVHIDVLNKTYNVVKVQVQISYNPQFIAWCNSNARRVRGESLWWWAHDLCSTSDPVPAPYIMKVGTAPAQRGSYVEVATLFVNLFAQKQISLETVQSILRSVRKGTLLDHTISKTTCDPVIASVGGNRCIYESVIGKLGRVYAVIKTWTGPVIMVGVTNKPTGNLMVKAVISCCPTTRLYDNSPRSAVEFNGRYYPVGKLDVTANSSGAYVYPENCDKALVILDTTPGSTPTQQNRFNMDYAEGLLKNGAGVVIVKLMREVVPCMTQLGGRFVARGRAHNGEYFGIFSGKASSPWNVHTLYPELEWCNNFANSSVNRGCDRIIFSTIDPAVYPIVRRPIVNYSTKDDEGYVASINVTKDAGISQPEFQDVFLSLYDAVKVDARVDAAPPAAINIASAPRMVSNGVIEKVASESLASKKISKFMCNNGSEFTFDALEQSLLATPSVAPQSREVYHVPNANWRLEAFDAYGMPVYVYTGNLVSDSFRVFAVSSGRDPNGWITAKSESAGLNFFTVSNGQFIKLTNADTSVLTRPIRKQMNASFLEFVGSNGAPKCKYWVEYKMTKNSLLINLMNREHGDVQEVTWTE